MKRFVLQLPNRSSADQFSTAVVPGNNSGDVQRYDRVIEKSPTKYYIEAGEKRKYKNMTRDDGQIIERKEYD